MEEMYLISLNIGFMSTDPVENIKGHCSGERTMNWKIWFPIVFLVFCISFQIAAGDPDTRRLYDDLLKDLNPLERPVESPNDTMSVDFGLTLMQIRNVDIINGYVELNMWKSLKWNAYNLRWDPKNYSGVDALQIPPDKIWVPDIYTYNHVGSDMDPFHPTMAVVAHDGNVSLIPPGISKTSCSMDIRNYPFENFTCDLKFGSWVHDGLALELHMASEEGIDLSSFVASPEWKVLGGTGKKNVMHYACCPEPYIDITYTLTLQRRGERVYSSAKMMNFVIMGLLVMSYLMGPSNTFRIFMATCALIMCFLAQQWCHPAPTASLEPPYIAIYFVQVFIVSFTILFTQVLCYHFYFKLGSPPELVKKMLDKSPIPRPRVDNSFTTDRRDTLTPHEQNFSDLQQLTTSSASPRVGDWRYLAVIEDKVFFYFWTIFLIIFYLAAFPTFDYTA